MTKKSVKGFSKLSKEAKIEWIANEYLEGDSECVDLLKSYWHNDAKVQKIHDEFIENTISNFYVPFGIAPNFLINDQIFCVPMAIEESSVVAAASKAAKFWLTRGGFKAAVLSTTKIGQVHFMYHGDTNALIHFFNTIKPKLIKDTKSITKNMDKRGGGILDIELRDKTKDKEGYFQLHATFETLDAMGANFINSCLEQFAKIFKTAAETDLEAPVNIVMSILSNYVPDCLVRAEVSCKVEDLSDDASIDSKEFVEKFIEAVSIAQIEPHRAVTHNKGIMNGIDAVILATGNDFRAVEAGVHAYAAKDGQYRSLTHATNENGIFKFWIEIPLALGTVGGLTSLHPLVKLALKMLGKPSAKELMQIVAVAGLAQNFAALRSLTTTGIQQGHMKMHIMNILNQFQATDSEKKIILQQFKNQAISHSAVVEAIEKLRQ